MNVEFKLFAGAAAFAGLVGAIYWFASYEHSGTTMLVLSGVAFLMVAAYLAIVGRRVGRRPSDRADADPGDEADLYGPGDAEYFPPSSVWPFVAANGVVVLGLGLVFGAGVGSLGVLLLVVGIAGFASEANAKP